MRTSSQCVLVFLSERVRSELGLERYFPSLLVVHVLMKAAVTVRAAGGKMS